jgi:hypothetical protein
MIALQILIVSQDLEILKTPDSSSGYLLAVFVPK